MSAFFAGTRTRSLVPPEAGLSTSRRPPRGAHPMTHGGKSMRTDGGESTGRYAYAVIGDLHEYGVAIDVEGDIHGLRSRVLEDICKGLLRNAKQRDGRFGIEFRFFIRKCLEAFHARGATGLLELPAQCGEQTDIVQQRGPQFLDDAALQVDSRGEVQLHSLQTLPQFGIVFCQVLLGPGDIHSRAHQQAAQFVVQFAGETCPLSRSATFCR